MQVLISRFAATEDSIKKEKKKRQTIYISYIEAKQQHWLRVEQKMKMVRILQIKAGDERQKMHNCTHPYTALQRGCRIIASSLHTTAFFNSD